MGKVCILFHLILLTVVKLSNEYVYKPPAVKEQGLMHLIIIVNNNFWDFKGISYQEILYLKNVYDQIIIIYSVNFILI